MNRLFFDNNFCFESSFLLFFANYFLFFFFLARKARHAAESLRDVHLERIHELESVVEHFHQDRAKYVHECQQQVQEMEQNMLETNIQATTSTKQKNEMKQQLDDIEANNRQLLLDIQKATDTADRMEGERNVMKFFLPTLDDIISSFDRPLTLISDFSLSSTFR